jgi:nitrite reductase/ring-hydroxylating ferredoxin subunit
MQGFGNGAETHMTILCRLDEIDDGKGRGFTVEAGGVPREIFIVRKGTSVYGYRNVCPHAARRLDHWEPDEFTTPTGDYIQCTSHDARFQIEDGLCIAGPTRGKRLKPISVHIDDDGCVILATLDWESVSIARFLADRRSRDQ